jgi:hypothetical protein
MAVYAQSSEDSSLESDAPVEKFESGYKSICELLMRFEFLDFMAVFFDYK